MPERPDDPLPFTLGIEQRTPHQSENVVRDGGIADADAAAGDLSRDTYGSPIGPGAPARARH